MDYGWWSLVPPVVAIVSGDCHATRGRVAAARVGGRALILKDWSANWNPFTAVEDLLETHLWTSLCDEDHIRVFAFTALMGAMIGVIHRIGGMHGVVRSLAPLARTRRGGQLLTWLLGLLIFIDDYANSLLLGNTMRPLTDRLRISREKLAYLVDSTAAPVAGLAVISTWVAGEIGYIEAGFESLDLPAGIGGRVRACSWPRFRTDSTCCGRSCLCRWSPCWDVISAPCWRLSEGCSVPGDASRPPRVRRPRIRRDGRASATGTTRSCRSW